jgi:diphthamide synthase (EF-2-diphthine--ammonia ligase)
MSIPVLMCWSCGKDSARALHELRRDPRYRVVALLTTITREFDRVSMHGIRRELLERQARELGLPLSVVEIPSPCSNADYESAMRAALAPHFESGVRHVAFGDIFLEDLRRYREEKLASAGMTALFPIFGRSTTELARELLELGFGAVTTCIDLSKLPASFAGRPLDASFFTDLPPSSDPCGENGEYHTFVHASPDFSRPIPFDLGERIERDGFAFADVLPRADALDVASHAGGRQEIRQA